MKKFSFGSVLLVCLTFWSPNPALSQEKTEPAIYGRPLGDWVERLKDSDPGRRVKALYAIGRIGPEAGQALPDMAKTLKDEKDLSVRLAYQWALRQINPAPVQPPAAD